jgi:dihydropteroate synthase
MIWQTSKRQLSLERPLLMGIVNVTPDSFSDGGRFDSTDEAVRFAEKLVADGADLLDIGGESTRPGSKRVTADEEIARVVPVIERLAKRVDVPLSIDTCKASVAAAAIGAGAEIVNDISGLRFDVKLGDAAAAGSAGLILMHSRGEFHEMHSQEPVDDIFSEVENSFRKSLELASRCGVSKESIVLDVGIGFGKTVEQNLSLIADLDKIIRKFEEFPVLVGASRKSFIGKLCDENDPRKRIGGSLAAAIAAVRNGAHIIRVHDVYETRQALKTAEALKIIS